MKTGSEKDVCLTFDDGLLCQYEIAYPVLKHHQLTAFWFIYTSPMNGIIEKLEIYRDFRCIMFNDIDDFYFSFFDIVKKEYKELFKKLNNFNPDEYLKNFAFYSINDKKFRYMRDIILGEEKYNLIMDKMINDYKYNIIERSKKLWLSPNNISDLFDHDNLIGLHSFRSCLHKRFNNV